MCGVITTKDLVTSALTIIAQFGMAAYLRCWTRTILSHRQVTFLECVVSLRHA